MTNISNFGTLASPCYSVSCGHFSADVERHGRTWAVTLFRGEERMDRGALFFDAREAYTWASWAVRHRLP